MRRPEPEEECGNTSRVIGIGLSLSLSLSLLHSLTFMYRTSTHGTPWFKRPWSVYSEQAVGDKAQVGHCLSVVSRASQPLEHYEAWKPAPVLGGRLDTEGWSGEARGNLNGEKLRQEQGSGAERRRAGVVPHRTLSGRKALCIIGPAFVCLLVLGIVELSG
jgi:hypothetical protein